MNDKTNVLVAAIVGNQFHEMLEPLAKTGLESAKSAIGMIEAMLGALGGEVPWSNLSADCAAAVRVVIEQHEYSSPEEDLYEIRTALRMWFTHQDASARFAARQFLINESRIDAPDLIEPE